MKHLAFFFLAFVMGALNLQATKILCHGEGSDRDDEAGVFHAYTIGLEFDVSNGIATIWERRDDEPVLVSAGESIAIFGQTSISYSTVSELDLITPVDPYDIDWSELPSLINWQPDSPCFIRVEVTGFSVREDGRDYLVTYDQDGSFVKNPSDACLDTQKPQDHNARIGMRCMQTDGDLNELIGN